jgi:hypothetical protein
MTTLFTKPKTPDTSKQQALLAAQDAALKQQENDTARRNASALNARKSRNSQRASLITGGETGVLRQNLG